MISEIWKTTGIAVTPEAFHRAPEKFDSLGAVGRSIAEAGLCIVVLSKGGDHISVPLTKRETARVLVDGGILVNTMTGEGWNSLYDEETTVCFLGSRMDIPSILEKKMDLERIPGLSLVTESDFSYHQLVVNA